MKKTLLTALVLIAAVSMSAAANGVQENSTVSPAWGQGYGRGYARTAPAYANPPVTAEEKTITGTLRINGTDRPVIVSGGESYELMFPYYYGYNLDVKDGQEITVKGYEVPAYRWAGNGSEKYLRITEAEINGKDYILAAPGAFGPGRGRTGGRGMGNRGGMGRGAGGGNWNNTPYNRPYAPYAPPYGGGARW